ncbi:hypothetical protein ISF_05034 [Cordyceps fumosorosea ARSEF 2679]|uniref:DUF3669 domain-containing protein n=1 Tax=Cordyceps fumosorosea (strain ARSEF 2679) TaxID=1081104 RepID=A0A167VZU8_CORFA|nr:hypothetical protein ISF_05034 [Cordyceps fumosorosea ARSEF 2679]OAA63158.1 hypothetical protein ISF_05034 [Cordyceps fumosorosea ARSEF 2679]
MEAFLNSTGKLTKIGQGFCGTVWAEEDGGTVVIKLADGEKHDKNYKDNAESGEGARAAINVNIPHHITFLNQTPILFWPAILPRLPAGFEACEALVSERIPPMSLALARDKANESCLVRPYLGRRRPEQGGPGPKQRFFSLRNFPLHMDQMEELGLPVAAYATAMADALAFLHWTARVDACDVELVLAAPRSATASPWSSSVGGGGGGGGGGGDEFYAEALGAHGMWMLDFDCCRPLEMSAEGMTRRGDVLLAQRPVLPAAGCERRVAGV